MSAVSRRLYPDEIQRMIESREEMQGISGKRRRFNCRRIGTLLGRTGLIMKQKTQAVEPRDMTLCQTGEPRQTAFIQTSNGSLRDEHLNFENLDRSRKSVCCLWPMTSVKAQLRMLWLSTS